MEKTLLTLIFCVLVSLSGLTLADSFNRSAMLIIDNTARNNDPMMNPTQQQNFEMAHEQFENQSQKKDLTQRIEEYVNQPNAKQNRDFDLNNDFRINNQ